MVRGYDPPLLRARILPADAQPPARALLRRHDTLKDLDFTYLSETHPEELFNTWLELPESQRNKMDAELREIFNLSCEKGWCAIRDEADWHLQDAPERFSEFVETLSALASHYERAMVTFLDHRDYWQGATLFCHADTLSYWRKRKGFPPYPADVREDGRRNWPHASAAISIAERAGERTAW